MIKPDVPEEVQLARDLSAKMALEAIALGGTCTGEHGIGAGKIDLLKVEMVYSLFDLIIFLVINFIGRRIYEIAKNNQICA